MLSLQLSIMINYVTTHGHWNHFLLFIVYAYVKLQNLSWYKTGFVSRQVLHLLSKLQNWICPKTGQYKACILKPRYGLLNPNPDSQTLCPRPTVANVVWEPIRIGIRCASHSTVLIRITSYYFAATFVLVRRPIRMFWNVQNIRISPANRSYSYCVVLHRRTSYQFVSVPIGSYLIVVHSYRFVVHSHWDSSPVCCDSVRCNTMRNDRIVVLDRTCSHWFV